MSDPRLNDEAYGNALAAGMLRKPDNGLHRYNILPLADRYENGRNVEREWAMPQILADIVGAAHAVGTSSPSAPYNVLDRDRMIEHAGAVVGPQVAGGFVRNALRPHSGGPELGSAGGRVGGAAENTGIRGYHGSPHDFDKFDLRKIGTGEGAQAYGHGLYFADNEGVAKSYKDKLGGVKWQFAPHSPDEVAATNAAQKYLGDVRWDDSIGIKAALLQKNPAHADAFEAMMKAGRATDQEAGHMYEVNIKADPEHFLDWDKPLKEQPEQVRSALGSMVAAAKKSYPGLDETSLTGQGAVKAYTGHRGGNSDVVSDAMREAGIPGIKYLDAGSRGAGEGSRNYVVFDDKIIEILRKYGLAPVAAGGLMSLQDNAQAAPNSP